MMTLLCLYPYDSSLSSLIEDKKYGIEEIVAKKDAKDIIPKITLRTYLYEISRNYEQ